MAQRDVATLFKSLRLQFIGDEDPLLVFMYLPYAREIPRVNRSCALHQLNVASLFKFITLAVNRPIFLIHRRTARCNP